ncbi:hypothetical protein [Streptomyces sp. NPDC058155]|uniref:hypothetical protein n=1 Tax=Streptomyces sp. NPDC058155 TaxID=3346359 RepID=UPI0036EF2E4D
MTRLGWQYRAQGSGRVARQRVTVTGGAPVDEVDGVIPRTDPDRAVEEHAARCTTCALLRSTGAYCQGAARLREEAGR